MNVLKNKPSSKKITISNVQTIVVNSIAPADLVEIEFVACAEPALTTPAPIPRTTTTPTQIDCMFVVKDNDWNTPTKQFDEGEASIPDKKTVEFTFKEPRPVSVVTVETEKPTEVTVIYTGSDGKEQGSIKDAHGRSAASGFTSSFIAQLNAACNRVTKPVFNHGAEAQNVSFTQAMDRRLALFSPGSLQPVMIPRLVLPGVLHDLLLHGYLVIRNPKWLSGCTLGIEDMAEAEAQFPDDGAVKGGVAAKKQLETNAANRIKQFLFKKGDGTGWQERYAQLRYFRAIGRTADVNEISERLLLPDSAFPKWGPGSEADVRSEVQRIAREAEAAFGRTGFVKEDGHVSPVDQSKSGPSVSDLRRFWESQRGK